MVQFKNKEGKRPLDLSKDQNVTNLLKLVELFEDAKNCNLEIISKLKAAKLDEFTAIINTHNDQGKSLIQVAIVNKHQDLAGKLEMLKKPAQTLQDTNTENRVRGLNLQVIRCSDNQSGQKLNLSLKCCR